MITVDESEKVTAYLVPVHIQHTGDAAVSKYFKPKTDDSNTVNASFRGVKLSGTNIALDYQGTVIEKTLETIDDDGKTENNYRVVAQFDLVTIFGHDYAPVSNQFTRVNQWNLVADIIHG